MFVILILAKLRKKGPRRRSAHALYATNLSPMDFGVGQTPVDINLKIAHVERTMAGEGAAAEEKAAVESGSLWNVCRRISNKTAYAEEVQVAAERVETPPVAEKHAKKANDGGNVSGTSGSVKVVEKKKGNESYSVTPAESEDEEEILEDPPKKTDNGDVKNTAGFDWYKLTDKGKTQFTNKVNRHASSLTLT